MRIVLTGAGGQLGAYLLPRLLEAGHNVVPWTGSDGQVRQGISLIKVDFRDLEAVGRALETYKPEVIVHAAALSTVEGVRLQPGVGRTINVEATKRLADWSRIHDARLIFTSTDLVFDGSKPWNNENDPARPLMAYGRSKHDAEPSVLATDRGVVARLSLLFGKSRSGRLGYFDKSIDGFKQSVAQTFFNDEYRTPLDLDTASQILTRLVDHEFQGVVHIAGCERMSRYQLMSRAAVALGYDPNLVRANHRLDVDLPEPRPADVSLDTNRLTGIFPGLRRPTIEQSLSQVGV